MSKTRVNNIEPFSADSLRILGKGFYAPKLTTVQRNAIVGPEDGLTIYNTDSHALEHYNTLTSAWESSDGVQSINGMTAKNQTLAIGSAGLAPSVIATLNSLNTINIPYARTADVTGGLISKAEYDSFNIRRFPVKNVMYVVKNTVLGPQDFNTLTAALAAINDASPSNPYKIEIGPGVYVEDTIIMKSWVWVEGAEQDQTVLSPTNVTDVIIEGAPNSGISKCLITGATSGIGVQYMTSVGDDRNSFFIEDCRFGRNQTHVIADSTNSVSGIFMEECRYGGAYQFTTGFVARNGGRIVIRNSGTTSVFTTVPDDVFVADGVNSELVINAVQCRNGNAPAGNAIRVRNGAKIRVLSFNVKGWSKAIFVENVGAAPFIQVYGIMNQENTIDLQVDHPGTDGVYSGSADHTKITINSASSLGVSITSNAPGEAVGTVTVGSNLQGDRYDRLANLSLLNRKSATLGVIEDVEADFVQIVSGLQVQVNAGRGFLNDPTELFLKEISWPNTPLTLGANQSYYIYVDANSVVQFSPSFPGLQTNILLGRVNTSASTIRFIENSDMSMNHYGNRAEDFFRMVLGPVFRTGCIVTENTSPRKLDLTAGSYQYGVGQFEVPGGTAITFETFRRDGSGGFISNPGQDTLSNTQYDDGTGTLASIPAGHYARHHLYLMEDKYFVVYAQATYAALADALTAPLPTIPNFMSDAVVRIAGIIVQEGIANIYSSVIDIRPRIGFAAPSGTAVTDHGSLTGLNDVEDHPGYLTLNGLRAMAGNLNMGGQNITNVNLVDGVDVSAHAARHLPNGADPLATAAPTTAVGGNTTNQEGTANSMARSDHQHDVATGVPSTQIPDQTNAEGSSNNLARADHQHNVPTGTPVAVGTANNAGAAATFSKSDHVHNHGSQSTPTHHAVATTGANGFMSSADKTKLDGIEPGSTADQIASEVPYTPTGTVAANNVQDAITELDTEKVPKTTQVNAGAGLTGGGDLSSSRTIAMPNVGTPNTYGSATQVPVVTTDAQGRVTGVTNTPINGIPAANITHTPTGNIAANNVAAALNELDSEKQAISEKGQANGYASLGGDGKVPLSQLPDTVVGAVDYQGSWNASTNTPNLGALTPSKGDYYVVSVGGTGASLGGFTDWMPKDWAIYNGTAWEKVDNTDAVSTVFGRQGAVTAQNGDYNAGQITNTPAGDIAAVTVQAAINELDSEKVAKTTTVSAGAGLTGGGDLSANRTISMPNVGTAGTYGAADTVPVATTDAQGRVTGVTNTAIAILAAAVTNFAASVRGTLLAGYTVGTNVALDVADSILVAFGKVQAQLNAKANLSGGNTFVAGTQTLTPTLATDTALAVTQGRTVLGGTTPQDITGASAIPIFQIQGLAAVQMAGIQYSADTIGPVFNLLKSRGATLYSQGLVLADDEFGRIQFRASDGTNFQAGASIRALVDGTAAAGSMPGRLIFMTTPSGSTTPVERLRIDRNGLVRVVDVLQRRCLVVDFDTIATAATTTTLTVASAARQITTGSTAGQIVRMPDATLLTVGAEYEIRNTASVTIAVQDNAGGALDTTPAGTGTTVLILTANGTAAGTWIARTRFEPFFQDVTAIANHVVNTTGDTLVTGMTLTPQAGIYDVEFEGILSNTTSANGQTVGCGVYINAAQQAQSDRAITLPTNSFGNITPGSVSIKTGFTVTVNGSQAINIRARRAAGTVGITGRRLKITRVG